MQNVEALVGSQVYLRLLNASDVSMDYVSWLNDVDVNRYLESRHVEQTYESCKIFVNQAVSRTDTLLFGIFCNQSNLHIGNIKLGPISERYNRATLGLMIGDKKYWGRGIAREIINLITTFSKDELGLNKIEAGCYCTNKGSEKAFLREGYQIEGLLRNHVVLDGEYEDCILLGKILN